jgi:hypothetical protein
LWTKLLCWHRRNAPKITAAQVTTSAKVLTHEQDNKQVGKDFIDMRDADGREFVEERVELAK